MLEWVFEGRGLVLEVCVGVASNKRAVQEKRGRQGPTEAWERAQWPERESGTNRNGQFNSRRLGRTQERHSIRCLVGVTYSGTSCKNDSAFHSIGR